MTNRAFRPRKCGLPSPYRRGDKREYRRTTRTAPRHRRLIVEPLEARQLLAAIAKFDFDAEPAEPGPPAWTHITAANAAAGTVDPSSGIGIKFTGLAPTTYTLTHTAATVPSDAVGIRNGIARAASSVNITFALTNLDPLKSYEVWVLGGNNFGTIQSQQVSIEGAQGITSFTQTIANLNLWVNSAVGDSSKAVADFSPIFVQSPLHDDIDGNGTLDTYVVRVTATRSLPSTIAQVAGVVIREFTPNSSFVLPTSGGPFTLLVENGNRVVKNNSGTPLATVANTGAITISGTDATSDTLIVDLSSGNPLVGGLTFAGGAGGSDKLLIAGGNQGAVDYNYASSNDGSIVMSALGTISYTGLEQINISGTATDAIFNLPAGPNSSTLEDDGTTGNTRSRLSGASFVTTDFANPTGTATVKRGNAADVVTVNSVPDFTASLAIGSAVAPFNAISLSGTATLASGKILSVTASAVNATAAAAFAVSGGGSINVSADNLDINATATLNAGAGSATIRPLSAVRAINLGTEVSGQLSLADAELDRVTAATVNLGDANSGAINITATIDRPAPTTVNLASGTTITFAGGALNTGGGDLMLTPGAASSVGVATIGNDVTVGAANTLAFAPGSDLAFAIDGKTVDTQFQQLNIAGKVDLTGVDLVLTGTYTPETGDTFVIIQNDGTDAVTATFNSLPEGKVFAGASGSFSGTFQITYRGGDGNDVVLTALNSVNPILQGTPGDDYWIVELFQSNASLSLNNNVVWSVPLASLNSLIIDGLAGDDTFAVVLAVGNLIPAGSITLHGGPPTTGVGDRLFFGGSDEGAATYSYTDGAGGSVVISNYGTLNFTGMESIRNYGPSTDTIFNLPVGPNIATLSDDYTALNGESQLAASTIALTTFNSQIGSLTVNRGSSSDALIVNSLPDFNASLTIGSADSPFGEVTFAGSVTLAANRSLSAIATGTIRFPNSTSDLATSGSGSVSLTTARDIKLLSGASIAVVDGDLFLAANQQATPTAGNFRGIFLNDATLTTSGGGSISLMGRGGDDVDTTDHIGVILFNGIVQSTASGADAGRVTIAGQGGMGSSDNNGIVVEEPNARVLTVSGDIQLTGMGGNGSATINRGVLILDGGQVQSSGTGGSAGNITIRGTGGTGTSSNNGVSVNVVNSLVSTVDGDISITGAGSPLASGSFNYGVAVTAGGQVTSTGVGTSAGLITIIGTGGGSGVDGSTTNQGVRLDGSETKITSIDGDVSIDGAGGIAAFPSNTFADGVRFVNLAQVKTTGIASFSVTGAAGTTDGDLGVGLRVEGVLSLSGPLNRFTGDRMILSTTIGSINVGPNAVVLQPKTGGIAVDLGAAADTTASTLELSDAELDRITAGTLQIGDGNGPPITISASITRPSLTVVNLNSGGAINFIGGGLNTGGGNVTLSPGTAASVGFAKSENDVTTGDAGTLSFASGSDLAIVIDGTIVDTQYQQLNVVGKVDLSGVDLVFSGNYRPAVGEAFTVVANDGSDAVVGEFNGLEDGKQFNVAAGELAAVFLISYHGGDGNDVVLTVTNLPPTLAAIPDPDPIGEDADLQIINLSGITAGGTQPQDITVTVTSSNPGLILDPVVSYNSPSESGSISYQPVANQSGTALITVTVKDNGGTASGGDTFSRAFPVRVTEVNDPPSGVNDSLSNIAEDAGTRTIPFAALLGNDSKGPSEDSQSLTITAVSNPVGGTVAINGNNVIFTPTEHYNGQASFTYTVRDNGTTNGTVDFKTSTAVASFTITEVNDAPKGTNDPLGSIAEDSGSRSIPFADLLANDTLGAANETGQTLTIIRYCPARTTQSPQLSLALALRAS